MPRHPRSPRVLSYFHVAGRHHPDGFRCCTPADYRGWQHRIGGALTAQPLRLMAYCLLPNEWHLLVGPTDPQSVRHYLARVIRTHPVTAPCVTSVVTLEDITTLVHTAREVERQALSLGLVHRAQDWPWGSLAGRLDTTNPLPLVSAHFLESRAWADFVNMPCLPRRDSADVPEHPRGFAGSLERRHHLGGL